MNQLGRLSGLPAKAAQMLGSTHPPPKTPSPVSLKKIRSLLENETPLFYQQIERIDPVLATASLGQVHRVYLKDGTDYAVKILFPKIETKIKNQLKSFLKLGQFGPPGEFEFHNEAYLNYFSAHFEQETSYLHEAQSQKEFLQIYPKIIIPRIYPEFSSNRVLTQSYEPALSLAEIYELSEDLRQNCEAQLKAFFIDSLLKSGFVHTDLQPKNWGYRPETKQIVLYDFGSTLKLTPLQQKNLQNLVNATIELHPNKCVTALLELGFSSEHLARIQQPHLLCQNMLSPWIGCPKSSILSRSDQWNFRMAGPAWFFLILRSASYVWKAFQEKSSVKAITTQLHVTIREKNRLLASLQLSARAIDELESLMPEATYQRILEMGHDLSAAQRRVQESNYQAQLVFEAHDPEKNRTYKVWIDQK